MRFNARHYAKVKAQRINDQLPTGTRCHVQANPLALVIEVDTRLGMPSLMPFDIETGEAHIIECATGLAQYYSIHINRKAG